MNILITGGAGFIGSHLVGHHLSRGDTVYAVDNLTTGNLQNIEEFKANPNFEFEIADINEWPNCKDAITWANRIYHMAAVVGMFYVLDHPLELIETNLFATEKLLKTIYQAQHRPVVVMASSSEVYGPIASTQPLSEEQNLLLDMRTYKRANYTISKLADEIMALVYNERDLPVVITRIFNTIGPRQSKAYGMVVPRFINQALENLPLTVFGDGEQIRCFSDVRDTVGYLSSLADNPNAYGKIVNVGSNEAITIRELAQLIIQQAKSTSKIEFIPYNNAYGMHFEDIRFRQPDLGLLKKLTNYRAQWDLSLSVAQLIANHN